MHSDRIHHQSSSLDWSEVVACPSCGAKFKASVSVSASGSARSHSSFDRDSAHEMAGVDAFANASSLGEAMIRRAKCPSCGKRGGRVFSLVVQSVFYSGLVAGGIIWAGDHFGHPRPAMLLGVALGVLLVPTLIWLGLSAADERVRFAPIEQVPTYLAQGPHSAAPATTQRHREPIALEEEPQPPPPSAREQRWANLEAAPPSTDAEPGLELDVDRKWNKKG